MSQDSPKPLAPVLAPSQALIEHLTVGKIREAQDVRDTLALIMSDIAQGNIPILVGKTLIEATSIMQRTLPANNPNVTTNLILAARLGLGDFQGDTEEFAPSPARRLVNGD